MRLSRNHWKLWGKLTARFIVSKGVEFQLTSKYATYFPLRQKYPVFFFVQNLFRSLFLGLKGCIWASPGFQKYKIPAFGLGCQTWAVEIHDIELFHTLITCPLNGDCLRGVPPPRKNLIHFKNIAEKLCKTVENYQSNLTAA